MKQLFDDPLFQMFAERALMTMTRGACGHREGWNRSRFDQQVFDWLDRTLRVDKNA